jgi:hypothetical protein
VRRRRRRARTVGEVTRRVAKAQERYDRALDDDDETRAEAVEAELARLRRQRDEQEVTVDRADALVEEWSATPEVEDVRRWVREVLMVVIGRVDRADAADELAAALRAALE